MMPAMHEPEEATGPMAEQDLLVILRVSKGSMGTASERAAIAELSEVLEQAALDAGVGEFDGDEYAGGECTLFFAGPDAGKLANILIPLLKRSPLGRGGRVVRQRDDGDGAEPELVVKL
jgi:hypothetical protein